jgi:hypothetical protein
MLSRVVLALAFTSLVPICANAKDADANALLVQADMHASVPAKHQAILAPLRSVERVHVSNIAIDVDRRFSVPKHCPFCVGKWPPDINASEAAARRQHRCPRAVGAGDRK